MSGDRRRSKTHPPLDTIPSEASFRLKDTREPIAWVVDAPDGGWGWVVVFATFIVHVIADGIVYSFGIMMVEFLDDFKESRGLTSWILSILTGLTLGAGPLAAAVTSRFGCRATTITGSLIAAFGCAISCFATSIVYLVVSVGVIMGLGFSLMYAPSIIMVTQYFDEQRALATGIAVCGAGIGTFLFSAFTSHLIEAFHWRGTFLIYAGFILNCAVCGALFRPLKMKPVYGEVELEEFTHEEHYSSNEGVEELEPLTRDSESVQSPRSAETDEPFTNGGITLTVPAVRINGDVPAPLSQSVTALSPGDTLAPLPRAASLLAHHKIGHREPHTKSRAASESHHHTSILDVPDIFYPGSLRNISRDYESHRDIYRSLAIIHQEQEEKRERHARHHHTSVAEAHLSPVKRLRIRSRSNSLEKEEYIYEDEMDDLDDGEETFVERARVVFKKMLGLGLLKDPVFLFFAISNFLTSIGFNIPLLYLPDRATFELEIDKDKVGYIVGAFGVSNTIGRVVVGLVSDKQFPCRFGHDILANRLWLYNIALTLCGIITCANFLCKDFYSLVIYSTLFGLLISVYVCLTSVILVDLLDINRLTNAFGLLLLFQGVSSIIGPPIGGWIVDASGGNYDWCFAFAGLNTLASGVMLYFVPCLQRRYRPALADQ